MKTKETPSGAKPNKLAGEGLSPKPTACEMFTSFRYLPLILGPVIQLGNSNWTLFLQLQTMTDIAYAAIKQMQRKWFLASSILFEI